MKRDFTSAELAALVGQLQHLFEDVQVEENAPEAGDGLTVGYASRLTGTDCVVSMPVTVDGARRGLRLRGHIAGAGPADDPVSTREMELYRDDLIRDFLTGAYNRRYWETEFCSRIRACAESGRPAAVALIKIDGFSGLLGEHGQPAMDQLVCYVANLWKHFYEEPGEKVVCRLTGHTYVVGCLGADEVDLENQMRVLYEKMHLTCTTTVGMLCRIPFTLSVACAGTDEGFGDWAGLYVECDRRLRQQSEAGGNGVYAVKK